MAPRDALVACAGRLLDNHRRVSLLLYLLGVVLVCSYPLLQRRVFIDENAFLHGHSAAGFSGKDAADAFAFSARAEAACVNLTDVDAVFTALSWFAETELRVLGLDVTTREYRGLNQGTHASRHRGTNQAGTIRGRDGSSTSTKTTRRNTHAVVRASKSPGREGVVFATLVGSPDTDGPEADAAAIGTGLAFVKFLKAAKWPAKDFVWLLLDARAGTGGGTASSVVSADRWLEEYYGDSNGREGAYDDSGTYVGDASRDDERTVARSDTQTKSTATNPKPQTFHRAGSLQQAYVYFLPAGARVDTIKISPEGKDGALPNLDLLASAVLLSKRAFPQGKVGLDLDLLNPIEKHARLGRIARSGDAGAVLRDDLQTVNAKFLSSAAETVGAMFFGSKKKAKIKKYVANLRGALRFAWRCARGIPTGAHASFKTFAVDAVTLQLGVQLDSTKFEKGHVSDASLTENFKRIGTLLETLARGSNNLVEQLHHSMFYWIMTGDETFLSIAEYIAPQAAVSVSALLFAVALATRGGGTKGSRKKDSGDSSKDSQQKNSKSALKNVSGPQHDWASALALVCATHLGGGFVGFASLLAFDSDLSPTSVGLVTAATALFLVPALCAVAGWLYQETNAGVVSTQALSSDRPRFEPPWVTAKCVATAAAATATVALTFFNFPLSLPTAAMLVPVCLLSGPSGELIGALNRSIGTDDARVFPLKHFLKARALCFLFAPFFFVTVLSYVANANAGGAAFAVAQTLRQSESRFLFQTLYLVVWPACTSSFLVTWMDVMHHHGGGSVSELRGGGKKTR